MAKYVLGLTRGEANWPVQAAVSRMYLCAYLSLISSGPIPRRLRRMYWTRSDLIPRCLRRGSSFGWT
jgi:hypothetical protein